MVFNRVTRHPTKRGERKGKHGYLHVSLFPGVVVKLTPLFARAVKSHPKMPDLPAEAVAMAKTKKERFLREMAKFEEEQGRYRSKCLL